MDEAIINELQSDVMYVLRVLGYSIAGDGALSEAIYFSVKSKLLPYFT